MKALIQGKSFDGLPYSISYCQFAIRDMLAQQATTNKRWRQHEAAMSAPQHRKSMLPRRQQSLWTVASATCLPSSFNFCGILDLREYLVQASGKPIIVENPQEIQSYTPTNEFKQEECLRSCGNL
ncbi:hypothetical protein WN944_014764 [Citrus x changshan-huyou]|uniref:Uncharacterized protein n=1 Tax=Citrus x changshan-huyou TaxID=2935761 RepID=A0AAP0M8F9_9ROSI